MHYFSDKSKLDTLLSKVELPKILSASSAAELKASGFGWENGYPDYIDYTSYNGVPHGVVLASTPQIDNEAESTTLKVVKLYGDQELQFRVVGVSMFEDVYDQSSDELVKDFRTLGDAADYAIAAHTLNTFEDGRILSHLRGSETSVAKDAPKPAVRQERLEDDGFSI